MTQITVTVHDSEVKTAINHATLAVRNLPAKVVKPIMEDAKDEARTYPPELPNQRYVRTGKRYEATKLISVIGNNQYKTSYRITSNPRYADGRSGNPYVLGDAKGEGQAAIHRGRWNKLHVVVLKAMEKIIEKGQEYFRAVLERNGPP